MKKRAPARDARHRRPSPLTDPAGRLAGPSCMWIPQSCWECIFVAASCMFILLGLGFCITGCIYPYHCGNLSYYLMYLRYYSGFCLFTVFTAFSYANLLCFDSRLGCVQFDRRFMLNLCPWRPSHPESHKLEGHRKIIKTGSGFDRFPVQLIHSEQKPGCGRSQWVDAISAIIWRWILFKYLQ